MWFTLSPRQGQSSAEPIARIDGDASVKLGQDGDNCLNRQFLWAHHYPLLVVNVRLWWHRRFYGAYSFLKRLCTSGSCGRRELWHRRKMTGQTLEKFRQTPFDKTEWWVIAKILTRYTLHFRPLIINNRAGFHFRDKVASMRLAISNSKHKSQRLVCGSCTAPS